MAQSNKDDFVYFPKGAKVEVGDSEASLIDVGVIAAGCTGVINWVENQVSYGGGGKSKKQIKDMTIDAGFELYNLDPEGINQLAGDVLTVEKVAGASVDASSVANQIISGYSAKTPYDLLPKHATSGVLLTPSSGDISITSVTDGNGALSEGTGYFRVKSSDSPTGERIYFADSVTGNVTIVFGAITPVARTEVSFGSDTATIKAKVLRFSTTENGLVRSLTIWAAEINSGGLAINFKGANEEGLESMGMSFTGNLDTSRDNGKQLFTWAVDAGAA